MKEGTTDQWQEEEWDRLGRPIKITDSSGFEYAMNYDAQGRLITFGRLTDDGKFLGTKLVYNTDGQLTDVESSWGKQNRDYAEGGALKRVEVKRQGAISVMTFDAYGRPASQSAFDGGSTIWHYDPDEPGAMLSAIELPNGDRINYKKGIADKAGSKEIGLGPAAVRLGTSSDGRVVTMTWGKRF
jgi:YD repeat-containing protein